MRGQEVEVPMTALPVPWPAAGRHRVGRLCRRLHRRHAEELGRPARVARALVTAVAVVVLAACATAIGAVASGNWQVRPVLSGSMRPVFPIGGVLITQRVPTSSLRVGDVAVLHPPGNPGITYIHRIVWIEHRGSQTLVRTKGDANPIADPWTARIDGPVAYEGRYVLPYVGYAAVWIHSPAGRRVLLALAGAAFGLCGWSLRRSRRLQAAGHGDEGTVPLALEPADLGPGALPTTQDP